MLDSDYLTGSQLISRPARLMFRVLTLLSILAVAAIVLSCPGVDRILSTSAATRPRDAGAKPDEKSAPAELIQRARQQEDLRAKGSSPFELSAKIAVHGNRKRLQGEYRVWWQAKDRWVEKITIGDFQRVRFGVPGGFRQLRSLNFSPQVVFDFEKAIGMAGDLRISPEEMLGTIRSRGIDGVDLSCVDIRDVKTNGFLRELCMNTSTGLLMRIIFGEGGEATTNPTVVAYSQFSNVSGKTYPLHMRLEEKHGYSLEISFEVVGNASTAARELPAVPEKAEFWEHCDIEDTTPARLVTKISPDYPQWTRMARQEGTVSFYGLIEKDGSVSHLKVLQSASTALDQSAGAALQQWKYEPATCGGSPVRVETIIDVIFSLR
jgi:TonB family protein